MNYSFFFVAIVFHIGFVRFLWLCPVLCKYFLLFFCNYCSILAPYFIDSHTFFSDFNIFEIELPLVIDGSSWDTVGIACTFVNLGMIFYMSLKELLCDYKTKILTYKKHCIS